MEIQSSQLWYNCPRSSQRMIKNPEELRAFEMELIKTEKVDVDGNFRLLDALYEEALALGIFPPKDSMEGIEVDIRVARAVNRVQRSD